MCMKWGGRARVFSQAPGTEEVSTLDVKALKLPSQSMESTSFTVAAIVP